MYLDKLEIQGFKSFVNRTILDFPSPKTKSDQSITAIVGPNGSGKSNISDAIRWVLGEQSLKVIRCKKSEDIMFSGSEKKSRVGSAEVSIYLNNEDGQAPIDYTELVITRRIYRDGETEYSINGNRVRLFDILILLAKSNVGTKSFSIISQGMIDNVITATPHERREFFDEALGIRQYQIKRNQSLNKLERSEVNLNQSEQLRKEIEPRLKSLTRQVEKLKKKEVLAKDLRKFQLTYYSRLYNDLNKQLKIRNAELSHQISLMDTHDKELNKVKAQLDKIEQEDSRGTVFTNLQFELQQLNNKKNNLLREQTLLQGRMDIEYEKQGKLNLVWMHKKDEELNQKIKEGQKDIKDLKSKKDQIEKLLETSKKDSAKLNETIIKIENSIIQLRTEIEGKISAGPLAVIDKNLKNIAALQEKFIRKLSKAKELDEFTALQPEAQIIADEIGILRNKIADNEIEMEAKKNIEMSESDKLIELQNELKQLMIDKEQAACKISEHNLELRVVLEKITLLVNEIDKLKVEREKLELDIESHSTDKPEDRKEIFTKELNKRQQEIETIENDISKLSSKIAGFNQEEEDKKQKLFVLEREYQNIQAEKNKIISIINSINIEVARIETKREDIESEITYELKDLELITNRKQEEPKDITDWSNDQLFTKIQKTKYQLEQIGAIDPETVQEYETTKERFEFLDTQITDLQNAIDSLEKIIIELDKKIKHQFDDAFKAINKKFEDYFKILFEGGKARLTKIVHEEKPEIIMDTNPENQEGPSNSAFTTTLADKEPGSELDPKGLKTRADKYKKQLYRGVDIYACPPGKKLAGVEMLSGGERSLTAIALIAAIISYNPSPFVTMDEVDAALDEANSVRMAKIIADLAKKTQFILITHNRTVMNIADMIYGVTMTDEGISKLLSVKIEELDRHSARL